MVRMATELVLLGTAGAPLPVPGRVTHGHAVPAFGYRFETVDGSVVFSGDTTVNDDLIALAQGADILVHHVTDLGYLHRHGWAGAALDRMAGLHTDVTEVGGVAERAGVGELILSHYLPAEPGAVSEEAWVKRAGQGFSGRTHRGPGRAAPDSAGRFGTVTAAAPAGQEGSAAAGAGVSTGWLAEEMRR